MARIIHFHELLPDSVAFQALGSLGDGTNRCSVASLKYVDTDDSVMSSILTEL